MKKLYFALFVVFAFILAPFAPRAHALTLSLTPSFSTIGIGDMATVDLSISGLASGGAPSLGAFGVEVVFDPSILSFDSALFGSFLGVPDTDFGFGLSSPFETDIFVDTSFPGAVLLDEFSFLFDFELDALQQDSFTLASLTFSGSGLGASALGFGLVDLSDAFGGVLTPALTPSSVAVVPEPPTFLLLATGLAGIAFVKKKTGNHT